MLGTLTILAFLILIINSELQQYTPDQADWSKFQEEAITTNTYNTAHDPDSIGWISQDAWDASKWDGTIYNPSKMTNAELVDALCPSVDRVRGIREVFYAVNPFADNENPTKAEVDEWHRIALNHVRRLVGYTGEEYEATPDVCMFARAHWGDERKFTTMWDEKYDMTALNSAAGPCIDPSTGQGTSNSHCGASFVPDLDDQVPYLPEGHAGCSTTQGSEGVFSGPKSNIPWSIKWSRGLCNTLHAEGFWGGHTGPWFHREKFGFSFWYSGSVAALRAKWTGKLRDNLYCNPSSTDCDVSSTPDFPKFDFESWLEEAASAKTTDNDTGSGESSIISDKDISGTDEDNLSSIDESEETGEDNLVEDNCELNAAMFLAITVSALLN